MGDKDDLEYAKVSVPDLEYAKVSVLDEAEALKGGVVQQSPRAMRNSTRERILHPDEELDHEAEAFDPCVFSLLMANVVQDFTRFSLGTEKKFVRVARLSISLVMVTALIVIQAFLLISVNKLLCASAVSNIRELYSNYEVQMYHNHTVTIFTGKERGIPGYFDATQFYTAFNDEERSTLCQIPLAHLKYISCILMVWTLTCCIELRQVVAQTVRVLFVTPTIASMSLALASTDTPHDVEVVGLTLTVKAVIGLFVLLPRYISTIVLVWLGCRWLTATPNLGDVLLNGLALEFILMLKKLLFESFASKRSLLVVERTRFQPADKFETATYCSFFGSFAWVMLAMTFVWAYVCHLQQVLPAYKWDVHAVCESMGKRTT
ncbi:unnamed protein product [Polarella glacialis]|uniref:Transmembrane protein n=1 Tax=Polarella glacialis TaxID=89957 RepID=A0A813KR49_POLGL|nr:unnamed protein product [Polarella glacialis]